MPREWHDRHAVNQIADPDKRKFYRDIVADKKPYFMRYIYPALMKQYNTYIKNTDRSALREFQMTVEELGRLPHNQLTERQKDFLRYYESRLPVGMGDCVMNKICCRFEAEFDSYIGKTLGRVKFDYTIMKSGTDYTASQMTAIKKLYDEYNKKLQSYAVYSYYERIDEDETISTVSGMRDEFIRECESVCQNHITLCDILLDLCYRRSSSKKFAWDICGDAIIHNLLANNDWQISAPVADAGGDIEFCGGRYKEITKTLEEIYEYRTE